MDQALISSRAGDYDRLLAFLDAALAGAPGDPVLHHYRGFALFRKASALATGDAGSTWGDSGERAESDEKRIKALFEAADDALARADKALDWPESLALRSAATGQLIAYGGMFAAMRMGPRAERLLKDAMARDSANPRVWMLRGVADLHKPRLVGGSAEKAEASLRRALELFATDAPVEPAPWWGHAETYGWLGQALARQGRGAEAQAAYAEALKLQPENRWVRGLMQASGKVRP